MEVLDCLARLNVAKTHREIVCSSQRLHMGEYTHFLTDKNRDNLLRDFLLDNLFRERLLDE